MLARTVELALLPLLLGEPAWRAPWAVFRNPCAHPPSEVVVAGRRAGQRGGEAREKWDAGETRRGGGAKRSMRSEDHV